MKSYVRFLREPHRLYRPQVYRIIKPQIGYLYRANGGEILPVLYSVSDKSCYESEMLHLPPQPFVDVYYAQMMPHIKTDTEQEAAAVYFNPYTGQYIVVGSKKLFLDAKAQKKIITMENAQVFLENESPFSFDPTTYGTWFDPDTAEYLTFDDYFVPDVTGLTIADCMVRPTWDNRSKPWQCAMNFFEKYIDRLMIEKERNSADTLTTLLASVIACGNYVLLSQLLLSQPQLLARFRPTLQENEKFETITVKGYEERIHNLFHYLLLTGDTNCLSVLFNLYERPMELREFTRHPMFYSVGHHHIRTGNHAALMFLLTHNFHPDAVEESKNRTPLILCACRRQMPAMIESILSAGADPTKRDRRGINAFDLAAAQNDCIAMHMLLAAVPKDTAQQIVTDLAMKLPLSDDNQTMLGILKKYL